MKALLLILFLSLSSIAQTFVGQAGDAAFFIDQVKRDRGQVSFVLLQTPYVMEHGEVKPDMASYVTGIFHADCMSMDYFSTDSKSVIDGIKGKVEETEGKAEKPMVIFFAIDTACKTRTQ
jgi:hypothetical protein